MIESETGMFLYWLENTFLPPLQLNKYVGAFFQRE